MRAILMGVILGLTMISVGLAAGQSVRLTSQPTQVTLISQDRTGLQFRVQVGSIGIDRRQAGSAEFATIAIDGLVDGGEVGKPALPVFSRLIALPFGCDAGVTVHEGAWTEVSLSTYGVDVPLIPVQPPLEKGAGPGSSVLHRDQTVYSSDDFYSLPRATVVSQGIMRAVRVGLISVAPVAYSPKSQTLRVLTDFTVQVTFEHPDWDMTESRLNDYYSPYFEPLYRQMWNSTSASTSYDDRVNEPVTYVIVAHKMFKDNGQALAAMNDFIEWKTQKGFNVIVGYTGYDLGSQDGSVTSEEIKAFIDSTYNSVSPKATFALLVGDSDLLPPYTMASYYPENWGGSDTCITGGRVTDLYFCEFDGNGDILPDMYYGRFSAEDAADLIAQVNKTIEYEKYEFTSTSFLNSVVLVGGGDDDRNGLYADGEILYGYKYYFNSSHGSGTGLQPEIWLYDDPGNFCSIDESSQDPLAAGEVISALDNGACFVNYSGHGEVDAWVSPELTVSDVYSLNNAHRYPMVVANCCVSGSFASSSECIGEAWLRAADKGAIGYLGASHPSHWAEDYWFAVGNRAILDTGATYSDTARMGAWDGLFHDQGPEATDETMQYIVNGAIQFCGNSAVMESYIDTLYKRLYWEMYNLLGDPSVCTYLGVPIANDSGNVWVDPVMYGDSVVTVHAEPGSYVGITRNGVLCGAGYLDYDGDPSVEEIPLLAPFTNGCEAEVVITAQNRIPWFGAVCVSGTADADSDGVGNACDPDYQWICGDPDASGTVTMADIYYLIAYVFSGGCPPVPELAAGDANCDSSVNIGDAVYISNYLNHAGPAPCACQAKVVAAPVATATCYPIHTPGGTVVAIETAVPLAAVQFEFDGVPSDQRARPQIADAKLYESESGAIHVAGLMNDGGAPIAPSGTTQLLSLPSGARLTEVLAFDQYGHEVPVALISSDEPSQIPATYLLDQNYPNPFNPTTEISFALPQAGPVRLEVFNVLGQQVARLIDEQMDAGRHTVTWDASRQASGMYLYRLTAGDVVMTRKMMLIK